MKRMAVYLLVAVLFIGLLAGCGAGGEEASTPSGAESTTTTTSTTGTDTTTEGTDATIGTAPSETGDSMTTTDTATQNTETTQGTMASSTAGSTSKPTSTKTTQKTTTSTTKKPTNGVDMDAVFAPIVAKTPRVVRMTEYDPTHAAWSNIQAITYDGADLGGKKTKVFAYIGNAFYFT